MSNAKLCVNLPLSKIWYLKDKRIISWICNNLPIKFVNCIMYPSFFLKRCTLLCCSPLRAAREIQNSAEESRIFGHVTLVNLKVDNWFWRVAFCILPLFLGQDRFLNFYHFTKDIDSMILKLIWKYEIISTFHQWGDFESGISSNNRESYPFFKSTIF